MESERERERRRETLVLYPNFYLSHSLIFYHNFNQIGATVTKYPRSGRPAKKLFRFSFVEGKIYLTWKGKFGNQGVDLGEVREKEQIRK